MATLNSVPKVIPLDAAFAAIFEGIAHADSEVLGRIRYALAAASEKVAMRWMALPTTTNDAPDKLLSVDESAERLGVSPAYLYRNRDKLPFTVRLGTRLLFSERGVEKFIKHRSGR
jgi:predicted DNA-binding transcriptional regulator AlpA